MEIQSVGWIESSNQHQNQNTKPAAVLFHNNLSCWEEIYLPFLQPEILANIIMSKGTKGMWCWIKNELSKLIFWGFFAVLFWRNVYNWRISVLLIRWQRGIQVIQDVEGIIDKFLVKWSCPRFAVESRWVSNTKGIRQRMQKSSVTNSLEHCWGNGHSKESSRSSATAEAVRVWIGK